MFEQTHRLFKALQIATFIPAAATMSELHHLLTLPERPITHDHYLPRLKAFLKSGIPATYTLEQVAAFEKGEEVTEDDSNTTPLHILMRSLPEDITQEETAVVLEMMDTLFEYGAGWNFLDFEAKTIGDLVLQNGQTKKSVLYKRIVEAGVSAELLLRKINGGDVEFIEVNDEGDIPEEEIAQSVTNSNAILSPVSAQDPDATAANQETYLSTKLEYTEDALVTKDNRDGVMMEWENEIMKLAARTIVPQDNPQDSIILNIGFGMGIIDTYIQSYNPKMHYICEAHPDVLAKLKKDGWYDKPNVVILEGRWQDCLNKLLDEGEVFFDGIYYDTFSEHYQDMLDLYDVLCGLIKPDGIFSFFNGLGADREICYDVYKKIVEIDVATYGMKCDYEFVDITKILPNWKDVKRSYYNCDYYYHPSISFM